MKKRLILSVAAAMMFTNLAVAGEIKGLEAYGRVIYIGDDLANTDGLAAGGKVKYEREVAAGLTMGAALHLSLPLSGTSDVKSTALADGDGEFYGQYELYAAYTMGATTFKAGQLQLDTPLAGSDDVRIVPNLMDVVLVQNGDLPDTTLIGAYVFGFNGWDSLAAKRESFKSYSMSEAVGVNGLVGDKGVGVVAAIYKGLLNTTIQAWDYYGFDMLNAFYADVTHTAKAGGVDVTLAGQ
ncbi:MAG: OprD family outer membrane porin, partial [Campylobacterales bacterium]